MDFKRISHAIWMILAALFIVVLFKLARAESIYSGPAGDAGKGWVRINKITGEVYLFGMGASDKWVKLSAGESISGLKKTDKE